MDIELNGFQSDQTIQEDLVQEKERAVTSQNEHLHSVMYQAARLETHIRIHTIEASPTKYTNPN